MTDEEYKELEELYLKETHLRASIAKLEIEIEHIDATISDLNKDNVRNVALRYTWSSENHFHNEVEKPDWSAFNYPKLLAKALESYKKELKSLLDGLKHKSMERKD